MQVVGWLSLLVEEWVLVASPALPWSPGSRGSGTGRVRKGRRGMPWSRRKAAGRGMEVLLPALGTDLQHLFEAGGKLKAGMIIMNSVL